MTNIITNYIGLRILLNFYVYRYCTAIISLELLKPRLAAPLQLPVVLDKGSVVGPDIESSGKLIGKLTFDLCNNQLKMG